MPTPFLAEEETRFAFSSFDNKSKSIFMLFFSASSVKFTQRIAFSVISDICIKRFRFLSREVASATTTTISGSLKHI